MAEKKIKQPAAQTSKKEKKGKDAAPVAVAEDAKNLVEVRVKCRLEEVYKTEIVNSLMKKFNYKSVMQAPTLHKIVVNMGVGDAVSEPKVMDEAVKDLGTITGQKPSIRKAKQAISNFKLREGMNIGAMVTLRRERMYEFLDRFVNVALPRVRDFRGLSDKSFDGRGNYTLGLKEQIIFPEINVDKVVKILGMDITFVTTAQTDAEAFELLAAFGLPFRKKEIK